MMVGEYGAWNSSSMGRGIRGGKLRFEWGTKLGSLGGPEDSNCESGPLCRLGSEPRGTLTGVDLPVGLDFSFLLSS